MNKYLKYTLITIGIIAFIELQVLLFFTIKNNNTNGNKDIPQMNMPFNKGDMSMPEDDDISKDAITPGSDDTSTSKQKNKSNIPSV